MAAGFCDMTLECEGESFTTTIDCEAREMTSNINRIDGASDAGGVLLRAHREIMADEDLLEGIAKAESDDDAERFLDEIEAIVCGSGEEKGRGRSATVSIDLVFWDAYLVTEEGIEIDYDGQPYPVAYEDWEREAYAGASRDVEAWIC